MNRYYAAKTLFSAPGQIRFLPRPQETIVVLICDLQGRNGKRDEMDKGNLGNNHGGSRFNQ